MSFEVEQVRKDFPILGTMVHGKPLVYFDNAATTQKPVQVTDRIVRYYHEENSNVHRGVHYLSQVATEQYEQARKNIASFIGASSSNELVFTRGTTESMNLLATIYASEVNEGDEILITAMEHHSNLVPWQELCKTKGAVLKVVPVDEIGEIDLEGFASMINSRTRLVTVTHISNVLGTVNPVRAMAEIVHQHNIPFAVDGAQALAHIPVDVTDLDCDFYTGSAHKAYGPTGIGFFYGKEKWLEKLPPYHYGGEMVDQVAFDHATFNQLPFKFEAGTPNVAGAIGMDAALQYLGTYDFSDIRIHEDQLLKTTTEQLNAFGNVRILGQASEKTAVLSFVIDGVHPYDISTLLDQAGIAVRTGYHCAQPLIESMGYSGTLRASFALYNTIEEVDIFVSALKRSLQLLR
jgi:cysteine desulfurase/selenocysteine lyase